MPTVDQRYKLFITTSRRAINGTTWLPTVVVTTSVTVGRWQMKVERPNWRSLVSSGQSATNAYEMLRQDHEYSPGECVGKGVSGIYLGREAKSDSFTDLVQPPTVSSKLSTTDSADRKASTLAVQKVKSVNISYSGQTIVGEFRETIGMLTSPAKSLRRKVDLFNNRIETSQDRLNFLKRGKLKTDPWHEIIADLWLEFSFGVKPLLSDIADIADASLRVVDGIKAVRAVGVDETCTSFYHDEASGVEYRSRFTRDVKSKSTVLYVAGVRERLTSNQSPAAKALSLSGLTDLSEIVPTAWELVPYSFLIDYFVNIGAVLGNTFTSLKDVAWWSKTIAEEVVIKTHSYNILNTSPSTAEWTLAKQPRQEAKGLHVARGSTPPLNGVEILQFQLPKYPTQWINMAALLTKSSLYTR